MMRRMPSRPPPADAGFTLLEVLVAFVIAALALGVLFEGAVEGIRSTRIGDQAEEALSRARSHLATVGHGVTLAPTTQEGNDGSSYHWSLRILPLQSAAIATLGAGEGAAQGPRVVLYSVQVTERWSEDADGAGGRAVVLRTERVGMQRGSGP